MNFAHLCGIDGKARYIDVRVAAWASSSVNRCFDFTPLTLKVLQEILAGMKEGQTLLVDFSHSRKDRDEDYGEERLQYKLRVEVPKRRNLCFVGMDRDQYSSLIEAAGSAEHNALGGAKAGNDYGINFPGVDAPALPVSTNLAGLLLLHKKEAEDIEQIILGTFVQYSDSTPDAPQRIFSSTPVVSNGEFNAQSIIQNSVHFMRVTFALANRFEQVRNSIEDQAEDTGFAGVRFLSLSLRASPFMGALSIICELGYNLFAPGINSKILTEYVANPLLPRIAYVFVADFMVGGVELRVAESFAAHRQSTIAHCLCLGTYLHPDVYSPSIPVETLVCVSEKHSGLRFELAKKPL